MAKYDTKDPTWQYIARALIRARTYSRAQGHEPHGESFFFVSALALGLVMQTRNSSRIWTRGDGGPTLATDDPECIELAYADHYLNMRASTGLFGRTGYVSNTIATAGYDAAKKAIFAMRGIGREPFPALAPNPLDPSSMIPDSTKLMMMVRAVFGSLVGPVVAPAGDALARRFQENPKAPLSAPTPESMYWANQGNSDGLGDAKGSSMYWEWKAMQKYKDGHS